MTTHARVGFLLRWGCLPRPRGGMELPADQEAVKGLLRAMLDSAMGSTELSWTFFVDPEVRWAAPHLPCGSQPAHVHVNASVMDLREWGACRCGYRRAVVEELQKHNAWHQGQVRVSTALELFAPFASAKGRRILRWFALQLIWFAGTAIEGERVAALKSSDGQQLASLTRSGLQKALYRYFMAGRRAFANPVCLHLALDGGTLGKKRTTVGVIALPSNLAMVFPPQALF